MSNPTAGPHSVTLEPFDPAWATVFSDERVRLSDRLGPTAVRIDHVGSTSVPHLPAKPIVDIQISVRDRGSMATALTALAQLGYPYEPVEGFEDYPFLGWPAVPPRRVHVHLCVSGSHHERRHLAVRDHLRTDPEARDAYAALKTDLVHRTHGDRFAYIDGKREFVDQLERAALARPGHGSDRDRAPGRPAAACDHDQMSTGPGEQ